MARITTVSAIGFLSLFLAGCADFIDNSYNKALRDHPECETASKDMTKTDVAKNMLLGMHTKNEVTCINKIKADLEAEKAIYREKCIDVADDLAVKLNSDRREVALIQYNRDKKLVHCTAAVINSYSYTIYDVVVDLNAGKYQYAPLF